MFRGTTPTLCFRIRFNPDMLKEAWLTVGQNDKELFTKTLAECEIEGNAMKFPLSQDDTLKLTGGVNTQIQIRALTINDKSLASDVIVVSTGKILKDGVISA